MTVSCLGGRTEFPPLGVHGGRPGQRASTGSTARTCIRKAATCSRPASVISTLEAGGGGFGDPRKRPVEAVLEDVRAGLVSVEGALRDYGVSVDLPGDRAWRS